MAKPVNIFKLISRSEFLLSQNVWLHFSTQINILIWISMTTISFLNSSYKIDKTDTSHDILNRWNSVLPSSVFLTETTLFHLHGFFSGVSNFVTIAGEWKNKFSKWTCQFLCCPTLIFIQIPTYYALSKAILETWNHIMHRQTMLP